jgi:hypothetical protein
MLQGSEARRMKRLYNRLFVLPVVSLLLILLITSCIKVYSIFTSPAYTDWNQKQLARINSERNHFSFAVFGDNQNSSTTFKSLIESLNSEDVLFALGVGDLVDYGDWEHFYSFIRQVRGLNVPLLTAIGNHDAGGDGSLVYQEIFGRTFYSFTVGDAYFIVLDDSNTVRLPRRQVEWLKTELEKSRRFKYRFVFMHVPLFDPREYAVGGTHALVERYAGELNALLDRYDITMLFSGHIHAYYRGKWGHTPYIITGGGGAGLVGVDPAHDFYHYIKVTVDDRGVTYEVKKLNSPDFTLIARSIYYVWLQLHTFLAFHYMDVIIVVTAVYLLFAAWRSGREGLKV